MTKHATAAKHPAVEPSGAQRFLARSSIGSLLPLPLIRSAPLLSGLACSALFATATVCAATLDFKLSPELKGREQRIAYDLAASVGAPAPTRGANGRYTLTLADDAKANAAATALRERASVLWAQTALTDAPLASKSPEIEYHGRMLALTLKDPATAAMTVARLATKTGQALTLKRVTAGNRAMTVLPAGTTPAALAAVAVAATADGAVANAERVRVARHQWIPNDTMYTQQWSLGNGVGGIRAAQAWDITPSGSVAVAVLDTGIRAHPDLDSKRMSGYDLIRNTYISRDGDGRDADATDPGDADNGSDCSEDGERFDPSSWHGTHVAGIIAASTNNGDGMAGVAPNARIVPVRVLGRCGGTEEDIADGIRWAVGVPVTGTVTNPNPVKILNLSLGSVAPSPCSANLQAAIDAALFTGASVVVAAGNSADYASGYWPANCKGVISVAASQLLGDLSSYSNYGTGVAISAPGGEADQKISLPGVISTLNGGGTLPGVPSYASYAGTSMAAPHVAGVIALMITRDPTLTPGQVLNRLRASARVFPAGSLCASAAGDCGAGLLDAYSAVANVNTTRQAADVSETPDRTRLIELRDTLTGRYTLVADPIELIATLAGKRGGAWTRTGFTLETFSFTAQFNVLAIAQPICRARLAVGGAYAYSASLDACKAYALSPDWIMDDAPFQAALPNGLHCPVGSLPAFEMIRLDEFGYNIRTVWSTDEIARMTPVGWATSRISFCSPL